MRSAIPVLGIVTVSLGSLRSVLRRRAQPSPSGPSLPRLPINGQHSLHRVLEILRSFTVIRMGSCSTQHGHEDDFMTAGTTRYRPMSREVPQEMMWSYHLEA